jgi:hypothetical protein
MRDNHPNTKPVYQYLADGLEPVARFNSLREMEKLTKFSRGYVVRSISNNQLVHNKWLFSFTEISIEKGS